MIFYIVYDTYYDIANGKFTHQQYLIDIGFTHSMEEIREQFEGMDRVFCRTIVPHKDIQDYLLNLQQNNSYKYYKIIELIIKMSQFSISEFTPVQKEYYLLQMGLKSIYD